MLAYMVIREAKPEDWPAVWLILTEVGAKGETLTWDATRTEARARAGWMRELPGREPRGDVDRVRCQTPYRRPGCNSGAGPGSGWVAGKEERGFSVER